LYSENRQITERSQEQKLKFTLQGVDITRLRLHGVWRCLRIRRRSNLSTFFLYIYFQTNN